MGKKLGVELRWLGCACFQLRFGDVTVVTDPWITANQQTELTWEAVEQCDYITVSHGHYDHILDIPALQKKFDAGVLCPENTAVPLMKWADLNPMGVYPMHPGLELDFDAVKIKAVFGRHSILPGTANERLENLKTHPVVGEDALLQELFFWGDVEYRNYLMTLPDGTKILLWGNPLSKPEQRNAVLAEKPDILLLQVTNPNTPKLAAQLCEKMGCGLVIPFHTDFPRDYSALGKLLQERMEKYAPQTRCILPQYGQWIEV